mgnify:CR=1 FL=1
MIDRVTARRVLYSFVLTFVIMRTAVLLIMTRRIPDLFVHVKGTHVHHLNFGIFLLAGVGAYLLLWQQHGTPLRIVSVLYGIGLALTFDEFGMWLFLSGNYWGRASFDAIVIIVGLLGTIVYAPVVRRFLPRHWTALVALIIALTVFGWLMRDSIRYAHQVVLPALEEVQAEGPP